MGAWLLFYDLESLRVSLVYDVGEYGCIRAPGTHRTHQSIAHAPHDARKDSRQKSDNENGSEKNRIQKVNA